MSLPMETGYPAPPPPPYPEPEADAVSFTLFDIVRFYRRHLWLTVAAGIGIFALTLVLFLTSTKMYEASIDILPAESRDSSLRLSGGSIAQALIGDAASSPEFDNFIASLGSIQVSTRIMAHPDIPRRAFEDQWNEQTQQWQPAPGIANAVRRSLRGLFGLPVWQPPTAFDMRGYILANVSMRTASGSPATRLSFRHPDQQFAIGFLDFLVRELDASLREQRLDRLRKESEALRQRFETEQSASVRDYMLRWYSENQNDIIETESAEFFSFQALDPVSVSPQPVSPSPLLSIVISIILALLGAPFLVGLYGVARLLRRVTGPGQA